MTSGPRKLVWCSRRAVELDPLAAGYSPLGIAERRCGRDEESLRCYERALVLDPGYEEAHMNLAGLLESSESCSIQAARPSAHLSARPGLYDRLVPTCPFTTD